MKALVSILMKYKYYALFPLAAFEGPVVSLLAGFLVHGGYLSAIPAFIILIFGDIIPDAFYYYLGRIGNERDLLTKYSKQFKLIAGGEKIIDKLWKDHPRKTMFLSKLAYGFSIPFLISAGLVKMSYVKFFEYTIPITIFQYAVFMTIGYLLGKSYQAAEQYIKYGGLAFGVVLVIFLGLYIWIILSARKEIEAMSEKE